MIGEIIKKNRDIQPNSLFLEKLKAAIPEVFDKNGTFDKTAFDALLDENKINTKGENFHLKFLGESYACFISSLDTETVIRETDDSLNVKSENAYIIGDNLDALKHLRKAYSGKVNFIYIDPPYNTGNDDDFVYCDKFVLTRDQLIDKLGVSEKEADLILNLEGKSSHSAWCTFMYPRLKLAHDLLSDDGVIFVSIDDNEMADLKLLLDSIFGESCFINNFMWLHGKGKKNNQSRTLQQYILAYSKKDRNFLPPWSYERKAKGSFSNPDNDPRGEWFSGSISFSEERSNKNHKNYFSIKSPSGIVWTRQWMCSEDEMDIYMKENKIYFGLPPTYDNTPRLKIFPSDSYEIIPDNILSNVGTTRSAQTELDELLGKRNKKGELVSCFNNPKPNKLIEYFIRISSNNESSLVLDFFSGSATTADAVMSYNAEHPDKHLKYIMVQLPEVISQKKAAYEMGFRTIDEIGRERIRRVKEKLIKEYGDKIKGVDLDFKTFRIEKLPQNTLDKLEEFDINEQNLTVEAESMFDDNTIITTYKLCDGFSLVNSREKLTLNNAEYVYRVKDDEKECIYITTALSSESIRLLLEKLENYEISPKKIVVYGYALAFSEKTELEVNLKSIRRKGINDNILEIRY